MATLNAIGGNVDIDMTSNSLVNHAAQSVPVNSSQYSWTTTAGIQIRAFSFADDITFNATSPLGGTVHALQAVNSYVVGGLVGNLVSMTTAFNNENYWRPILSLDSTIFASSFADFQGAGDFVNVVGGETLTGSDDLFEGAAPPPIGATTQSFFGDAGTVQNGAVLTGGDDTINMRADGRISGDAEGVFGRLTGGDDTIVVDGTIFGQFTRVTGDVVYVSDLEQAIAPTVRGGRDTIIVKQYDGGEISGDILDAFGAALGTTTGGNDRIDGSANASSITAYGDVANLGLHTVKGGRDTLIGSATASNLLSGDAGEVSSGTLYAGADTLTGGESGDVLYGDFVSQTGGSVVIASSYTGDDKIYGAGGNDSIFGQLGDDTLDGGMGNDFLDGGTQTAGVGDIAAFDTLNVAVSADLLLGFAFGQGNDTLAGFESLRGSNRSDSLAGDNLANQIEGLSGDDEIFGRTGNDTLIGGRGKDDIRGGNGNDTITGGADADTLLGNAGNDTFNYDLITESGITAATRDVIQSFVQGAAGDRIDVTDIDARDSVGGNQNFAFIGNAAFSAEGQIRFDVVGTHTILEFNTSGASGAEMAIDLVGVFTPTAADFIL
jgi:Ca2+-binding RTX toxin-like protein